MSPPRIWTAGHSTRSLDELLDLLRANDIEAVADVRRFPGSKRHPHFGQESLARSLEIEGLEYHHAPELGGRRRRKRDSSPNHGWRVESFNAYADHMLTTEFEAGLDRLIELARRARTVILCAEALPWRCHRRLIADALTVRGWTALDILSPTQVREHPLTDFARVEDGRLIYPAASDSPD